MVKKKVFTITVILALLVVIAVQAVIIAKTSIIGRHEITTAENAIILAKAAILQAYGETEIQIVFDAMLSYDHPGYWYVDEYSTDRLGQWPHVLVRVSDGKVILKWK